MKLRQRLPVGILALVLVSGCGFGQDEKPQNQVQDTQIQGDSAQGQEPSQETPEENQVPDTAPEGDAQQGENGPADMGNQSLAALASQCVGQDVSALYEACGEPNDSSYEEDPVSKATVGYLFYDEFTVSTTLDEEGNETVSGVW